VPIIIKLAAGDIENDVKLTVQANPDVIAIDGNVHDLSKEDLRALNSKTVKITSVKLISD